MYCLVRFISYLRYYSILAQASGLGQRLTYIAFHEGSYIVLSAVVTLGLDWTRCPIVGLVIRSFAIT